MSGWIKLHRAMRTDWEWYSDINVRIVWMHLLLTANYEPKPWQGQIINKGQLVIGRTKLASDIGLTEQQTRTALDKLKSTNEITIKSTNQFSLITIVKWDEYQSSEDEVTSDSTNKITNEQPTDNQPINQRITTTKETKKIRNKERDISQEFLTFYESYPRKHERKKAERAFTNAIKKAALSEILEGLERYKAYLEANGTEIKFIKHPATWLNGECWKEEYENESGKSSVREMLNEIKKEKENASQPVH